MKKTVIRFGALLLAALLLACAHASAQELRLGDLVYVPAMSASGAAGAISLTVEGLRLSADGDEPETVSPLAGAEFGVYVYSSAGELTPWANPLFPSEPMRVRTGEGETLFSLPQGTEFYLRQESAPQGYLFDADALIPVDGDSVLVQNAMPGQIAVHVENELGAPVAGVGLSFAAPDGSRQSLTTDEHGDATLACGAAGIYQVEEDNLPEGVFAALLALTVDAQGERAPQKGETSVAVPVGTASRARVTFVHPAAGSVWLNTAFRRLGDDGEEEISPLPGVRLKVAGDDGLTVVSDANGEGWLSLTEGTYDIELSYEGELDAQLPLRSATLIMRKGEETAIELTATERTGRVALHAISARGVEGGAVMLQNEQSGQTFGPYAFDADGMAVSGPLDAGAYRIAAFEAPQETELGRLITDEQIADDPQSLLLEVKQGEFTRVDAALMTWESQEYDLLLLSLDDNGQQTYQAIADELEFALLDDSGAVVGSVTAQDGRVRVSALSGAYALRMEDAIARERRISDISRSFALPSDEGAIVFAGDSARLLIYSLDENGMSVSGARYSVTDGAGRVSEVETDERGEAVTVPLAPGEITVTTIASPQEHDAAQSAGVILQAGDAHSVEMTHPTYGEALLSVSVKSLDARGEERFAPLPGARLRLYRVQDGGSQMTDAGVTLTTGDDGMASVRLPRGEYIAQADAAALTDGVQPPQAVRIEVENTQQTPGELVCAAARGGVRVTLYGGELADAELAQVRFELVAGDGSVTAMTLQDGTFYAGDLAAGTYILRQTQIPQGYTLAPECTVSVSGAEVSSVGVPLEEYAVVTVSKTGLTFNDQLQTFVVPLAGEYGVYTMEAGEMRPYPNGSSQMTVWANVTPDQEAQGRPSSAKLPAGVEGTTYYLRELGGAQGFATDEAYHEVTLFAGQDALLACTVSSDRGFVSVDQTDAYGAHVAGGSFELTDGEGEVVLSFEMGDTAYQNPMAIPVGAYTLRQTRAAQGYTLPAEAECALTVEPYLTQGGTVAQVSMACVRIPQDNALSLLGDVYASREQDMTMIGVEGGVLPAGETLRMPQLTLRVSGENGERVDVISVVLSGVQDADGRSYAARVEYCLAAGGWQPSDARLTGVIDAPTAVSLSDVQDDICAVRVTYLDADTGLELAHEGFAFGDVTAGVRVGAQGTVNVAAQAAFEGVFSYRTELGGMLKQMQRSQQMSLSFATEGDGAFDTALAGRDGRISGTAFADSDADGLLTAQETAGFGGMRVSLLDANGNVVDEKTTDDAGHYAFTGISAGMYAVAFDAGEGVIFSRGDGYSQHIASGVADARGGVSSFLTLDAEHTDYVVNAGCVYASRVSGRVLERVSAELTAGYSALAAELHALDADDADEPSVTMTGETGEFAFTSVMPGRYELVLTLPEGYLCEDAQDGCVRNVIEPTQGEAFALGDVTIARASSISGAVRIDDDGDGVIGADGAVLAGVSVALLRTQDGYAEQIAQTQTNENGTYTFGNLPEGEYSVLFELNGEWSFTRYGADSLVFGAMSQTGSTQSFMLAIGQTMEHVDAGVTIPAQLTVSVFEDLQLDGEYNGREAMLEGASITLVQLVEGESAQEVTYKTDASGAVLFTGVSPGEYLLRYQLPGAWRATVNRQPGANPVSCVPQSTIGFGESEPFTLTMGQTGVRLYIGAMLSGSISGTAFYDDDANASRGEGEAPAAGVLAELLDSQSEVLDEAYTAEDGSYAFVGLAPGRYMVRFTADEGCRFSASERSLARGAVQASDGPVSATRMLIVRAGKATEAVDASVVRLCTVSGYVWEDGDADCVLNEDEAGLSGVEIHLMNGGGRSIVASTVTGTDGGFVFERVEPGEYTLRVDAPDPYVFSGAVMGGALPLSEVRDGRGYCAAFKLLGGAQVNGAGYGVLRQGSISGRVWDDANYNGVLDEGEEGLRYTGVTLLNAQGEAIASAQTGRTGEYAFDSLMPGEYALSITIPQGYVYTAEGRDSRAPRQDVVQTVLRLGELAMGEAITGVDVGALRPAKVGGVVWYDADDDGRRQTGDMGMQNVRVTLEMLSGADAGKRYETQTDALGAYAFSGVMPGQAKLAFELADGYAFGRQVSGRNRVSVVPQTDALAAQSAAFDIVSGRMLADMDVSVVGVGVISGVVWEDASYDGERGANESGVQGVAIALLNTATGEVIATAQTGEDGSYAIGFVRQGTYAVGASLPGDRIFTKGGKSAIANVDMTAAQTRSFSLGMGEGVSGLDIGAIIPCAVEGRIVVDSDEDGVPGEAEEGLADAVVTVMQGGTVVATARTDQDGNYSLETLRPDTYRVRVTLPADTLFTTGTQLLLANADAQEGETQAVTLSMGQRHAFEPVAVVRTARISGRAWEDADADGVMGASERALTGVIAELYAVKGDDQTLIARTNVGTDGRYAFSLLRSGTYAVRFTLPENMLLADRKDGPDTSSVTVVPGNVGMTDVLTLAQGDRVSDVNVGGILPGVIGDTVWLDTNGNGLQDYKEPLEPGVHLSLLRVLEDGTMEEVTSVVSDEYGYYRFSALRPGQYVVRLDDERTLTRLYGKVLGEIDSDFDPQTGLTDMIRLSSGEVLLNVDMGLLEE